MTGVETDRGRIQCEYFVNCAGQVELLKFFLSCFCCLRICMLPSISFFVFLLGFSWFVLWLGLLEYIKLCYSSAYPSGGVKEEKQCLPFAVHQRLDVNLLSSTCSLLVQLCPWSLCWEVHPSDRKSFALAVGEAGPFLSFVSPEICLLLLLSVMSSLLENTPDNCSFSASSCPPC